MVAAALDVVGYLPGPSVKQSSKCADLYSNQLFAYGAGNAVVVIDVRGDIGASRYVQTWWPLDWVA